MKLIHLGDLLTAYMIDIDESAGWCITLNPCDNSTYMQPKEPIRFWDNRFCNLPTASNAGFLSAVHGDMVILLSTINWDLLIPTREDKYETI